MEKRQNRFILYIYIFISNISKCSEEEGSWESRPEKEEGVESKEKECIENWWINWNKSRERTSLTLSLSFSRWS